MPSNTTTSISGAYKSSLLINNMASTGPARRAQAVEAAIELIHASCVGLGHPESLKEHMKSLSHYADQIEAALDKRS